MARPDKFPQWATKTDGTDNNVTDPGTGTNNVIEPGASKKLIGWSPSEPPPREWMNWLHRLYDQWLRWLDEITASLSATVITLQSNITGLTTSVNELLAVKPIFVDTSEVFDVTAMTGFSSISEPTPFHRLLFKYSDAQSGNAFTDIVELRIPYLTGTSNSVDFIYNPLIPSKYRPIGHDIVFPHMGFIGSTDVPVYIRISPTGAMWIYKADGSTWPTSGVKGIYQITLRYAL